MAKKKGLPAALRKYAFPTTGLMNRSSVGGKTKTTPSSPRRGGKMTPVKKKRRY